MTRFTIAVFLHLVGMVGLFIGYGLEWVASSLLRRSLESSTSKTIVSPIGGTIPNAIIHIQIEKGGSTLPVTAFIRWGITSGLQSLV